MTQRELDNLFASARNKQVNTSVEEVTTWVGAAAGVTAGVGIAAKLKLLIAKKAIIMLGGTLGTIGIITVSAMLMNKSEAPSPSGGPETTAGLVSMINEDIPKAEKTETFVISEDGKNLEKQLEEKSNNELEIEGGLPVMDCQEIGGVRKRIEPISNFRVTIHEDNSHTLNVEHHDGCCDDGRKGVKGNGNVTKTEREVSPFTELQIDGVFDVFIEQGSKEKIVVETDENLQEYVGVKNEGNRLMIYNECVSIKKMAKQKVYVTVKDLSKLIIEGIGNVKMSSLNTDKIHVIFDGVGNTDLAIDCNVIQLESEGVGNVNIDGKADKALFECAGVGNVNAYEFFVSSMVVENSSVGSVRVHASKEIKIDSDGVGSLHYKGDPEVKEINNSGIGIVKGK